MKPKSPWHRIYDSLNRNATNSYTIYDPHAFGSGGMFVDRVGPTSFQWKYWAAGYTGTPTDTGTATTLIKAQRACEARAMQNLRKLLAQADKGFSYPNPTIRNPHGLKGRKP